MEKGLTNTKAYYESKIEELINKKPKLSGVEIEELAESIADGIDMHDCWQTRYDIAFNKIHEKYG